LRRRDVVPFEQAALYVGDSERDKVSDTHRLKVRPVIILRRGRFTLDTKAARPAAAQWEVVGEGHGLDARQGGDTLFERLEEAQARLARGISRLGKYHPHRDDVVGVEPKRNAVEP
jgi:hypothetical protein